MTTGKEKARRLARGQGQANARLAAQYLMQDISQDVLQRVWQYRGRARPASAGWREPFSHWFTGRSAG